MSEIRRQGQGGSWVQVDYLKAAIPDAWDGFGLAVAVAGNRTLVGVPLDDSASTGVGGDPASNGGSNVGSAYVFEGGHGLTRYCAANPNATGASGRIGIDGGASLAANDLQLNAARLPVNSTTLFVTSQTRFFLPNPAGSAGNLCIAGTIGRFVAPGQVQSSSTSGMVALPVDLSALPQPTQSVAAQPGETWVFTAWYRDVVAGLPTSNFTDAIEIRFTP